MQPRYIPALCALTSLLIASSCRDDDPSSHSIFDTTSPERSEFDLWIKKNYTDTYNLEFNYLYNDKLTDNYYNVIPASIEKSKSVAILIKHIWMDAYTEIAGPTFLKNNSFREIQLIGSLEWDSESFTMGQAEGGLKVFIFGVNNLDISNIYICQDDPYRDKGQMPLDLNYWYFHTMHHEYCHILTQRKNYTTDFQTISSGGYRASDWVNLSDQEAAKEGFISGYGASEYNEDFAEIYANYVTFTDEGWQKFLDASIITTDDMGNEIAPDSSSYNILQQKVDIVKNYFQDSWGINLDTLRSIVTRRSVEASALDLVNLK